MPVCYLYGLMSLYILRFIVNSKLFGNKQLIIIALKKLYNYTLALERTLIKCSTTKTMTLKYKRLLQVIQKAVPTQNQGPFYCKRHHIAPKNIYCKLQLQRRYIVTKRIQNSTPRRSSRPISRYKSKKQPIPAKKNLDAAAADRNK